MTLREACRRNPRLAILAGIIVFAQLSLAAGMIFSALDIAGRLDTIRGHVERVPGLIGSGEYKPAIGDVLLLNGSAYAVRAKRDSATSLDFYAKPERKPVDYELDGIVHG